MQGKMKAAVFSTAGQPSDVLRVAEVDAPQPGPGEVLVRVQHSPIHPADLMFIGGGYRIRPKPLQIAGLEGAGIVVEGGAEFSLARGSVVAFRFPGAWAEYICVPADRCVPVSAQVPSETAAQFCLNPMTAYGLLDELGAVNRDCIVVNAATSSVARIVTGLALQRGQRVVGVTRDKVVAAMGGHVAEQAIGGDLASQLLALSGGDFYAGLLDSIGGSAIKSVLPALRQGATIVSYGVLEANNPQLGNIDMIYKNLAWKGFGIDYWLDKSASSFSSMVADLWLSIRRGAISLPVAQRFALEDVVTAIERSKGAAREGKVLLNVVERGVS
jgi:NADPH:quinone reductase